MAFSTAHCQNLVGTTIGNGTFLLVESMACGASGIVYRAVDLTSPDCDQYAVKCMSKTLCDGAFTNHLRREVILHQRVSKHPHICTIHSVYEDESFIYTVLDLVRSGDLRKSIYEGRGSYYRNDEVVRSVFGQILDAVAYCHKKGFSHRDLKPDNILTSEDGKLVWLADFGLATVDKKSREFRTGTLPYLSPGTSSPLLPASYPLIGNIATLCRMSLRGTLPFERLFTTTKRHLGGRYHSHQYLRWSYPMDYRTPRGSLLRRLPP